MDFLGGCSTTLLLLLILIIQSQAQDDTAFDSEDEQYAINILCSSQTTCSSCLTASPSCYWCSDCEYQLGYSGCNTYERLISTGCSSTSIQKHEAPSQILEQDESFSDVKNEAEIPIQMKPQKVSVTLSPFEAQSVSFQYRLAKDYPLDLYYLMDLTWSMRDDKDTLVSLRDDLPSFLLKLTKNFRLGFGSFADKPELPYTSTNEKRRNNPCRVEGGECEPTYSFRHRLDLTDNVESFVDTVSKSRVTANLDNAEGGFDALMQVMVCNDEIGWKQTSRKVIIFATDGILHFAGDGILGGAVRRSDKKCHLGPEGDYMESTIIDYPSLEEIFRVLSTHKISVIFAVTQEIKDYYENIKKMLPENVYVATLSANSSNILSLVKAGYESITGVIRFKDDSDDDIQTTYYSKCGNPESPFVETSRCKGIEMGKEYTFMLNMTMNKCPNNKTKNFRPIRVWEDQLGEDDMIIDVEMLCDCSCDNVQCSLDLQCPVNAKFECGKCVCLDGWSGRECDCVRDKESALADIKSCKRNNDILPCSGVGDCVCGACECDPGFEGAHCECKTCPISPENGQVCGGRQRGTCACGVCACQQSWLGPTCSCSRHHCIPSWSDEECSNRGTCNCGQCNCREINGVRYTGKYCETCADCENPACSVYEECVRCAVVQNCTEGACVAKSGTIYKPAMVDEFPGNDIDRSTRCIFRREDGSNECESVYTYGIERDWTVALNIYREQCTFVVGAMVTNNPLGFALWVAALTIFVGLLGIVVFKTYDYVSYRREFRHFEAQRLKNLEAMNDVSANPLYKSPVTEFRVPQGFHMMDQQEDAF